MYTYEYDVAYLPSMPVVNVAVSSFGSKQERLILRAIIDSGSDGSMIPLSILKQINAAGVARQFSVVLLAPVRSLTFMKSPYR